MLDAEIDGQRSLVAHVVPGTGLDPGTAAGQLDAFLARGLPRPMLPAAYAFRSAFPLTSSGKTDRRRLGIEQAVLRMPFSGPDPDPEPESDVDPDRHGLVAAQVRRGVRRVLGQTPAPDTDLFSLGLDSLSAILLRRALQDALRCELDQEDIFKYPTENALTRRVVSILEREGEGL
ncbi:phosphopantetheine-binding protein [Streptomyces spororaveus]|uniref:phosphopantetheine-binding protein n=1 Tax=Streptomyces spororaveus TaxID=284039 RepID=UPI0037BA1940